MGYLLCGLAVGFLVGGYCSLAAAKIVAEYKKLDAEAQAFFKKP